jgi:hypothetical protein
VLSVTKAKNFNCWVMHPVARVSTNTLIKTTFVAYGGFN